MKNSLVLTRVLRIVSVDTLKKNFSKGQSLLSLLKNCRRTNLNLQFVLFFALHYHVKLFHSNERKKFRYIRPINQAWKVSTGGSSCIINAPCFYHLVRFDVLSVDKCKAYVWRLSNYSVIEAKFIEFKRNVDLIVFDFYSALRYSVTTTVGPWGNIFIGSWFSSSLQV